MAPEILKKKYNEKIDIWSCGVIAFIMLSGDPPFNGFNDQEILQQIKEGKVDMSDFVWEGISQDAKDFIT